MFSKNLYYFGAVHPTHFCYLFVYVFTYIELLQHFKEDRLTVVNTIIFLIII